MTKPRPSFYVHRERRDGDMSGDGWVGPLRSLGRAERERDAWNSADSSHHSGWVATVHESTAEVRELVRAWVMQRAADVSARR